MIELPEVGLNPSFITAVIASLLVANTLAWCLEWWQQHRIQDKADRLAVATRSMRAERLPVTLVTGFLGAGKTTFINRILSQPAKAGRILVIVNEFGAASVDHLLMKHPDGTVPDRGDGIFVMENGCVCCSQDTPGSELERILDKLLIFSRSRKFDRVVIETTGLAVPQPILRTFEAMQMRGSRFHVDSVLAVIDCGRTKLGALSPGKGPRSVAPWVERRQVVFADVVLANKSELVDAPRLREVRAQIARLNPLARTVPCTHCNVELADVLPKGPKGACSAQARLRSAAARVRDSLPGRGVGGDDAGPTTHAEVLADGDVTSVTLVGPSGLRLKVEHVKAWLQTLVAERGDDLLRIKGVFCVGRAASTVGADDDGACFVVNGVGGDVSGGFTERWAAPPEQRASRLVIIGHGLRAAESSLRNSFRRNVVEASAGRPADAFFT
jgi:G3E family GTPase